LGMGQVVSEKQGCRRLRGRMARVVYTLLAGSASTAAADVSPLWAQVARDASQPQSEIAASSDFLGAAERLAIKFRGYAELSGEYRVRADQTISIPVIGRIKIADLNLTDLERLLADRIKAIAGREGYVTVDVSEYRPIYVSGLVRIPGAVHWQPGLTVLQAIALAGGTALDGSRVAGAYSTLSAKALDGKKRALATLARLRAEQRGDLNLTAPPDLVALVGQAEADELIDGERKTMGSRRNLRDTQIANLQRSISIGNQVIEGLRLQSRRISDQLQKRKDYVAKLQELLARGVIKAERGMEEEIKVMDMEEKITNISVGLARVEASNASDRRELDRLKAAPEMEIQGDIQKAERELAQSEIELGSARTAIQTLESANDAAERKSLVFQVVRKAGDAPEKHVTVDETSFVQPGDVLLVGRRNE
jgi:exopolysaccharide production protein ExoF